MIEPDREEVIVRDAICRAGELSSSIAEVSAIGCRKQIQDRFAPGVDGDRRLSGYDPEPSIVVGHDGHGADALELPQPLITAKKEGLILAVVAGLVALAEGQHHWTADGESKLIPPKLRSALGLTVSVWTPVEKVSRIKIVISQELKSRA